MTVSALPSRQGSWRLLRRAISLVLVLCLLGIVATFAVFAVPQLIGGEHSFVVLSGSMQPTMNPGDVIIVDSVGFDAIESGDIVTFTGSGPALTTHRVVDVVRDGEFQGLETKGDSNEDADQGLVRPSQLVGRVMTLGETPIVIPYAGIVIETARTQLGVYALVLVPLTLFVLNEIYSQLRRRSTGSPASQPGRPDARFLAAGTGAGPIGAHAVAEGYVGPGGSGDAVAPADEPVSTVGGLSPLDVTTSLVGLLVVVPYAGWMTLTNQSVLSAMVFAGSAVGVVLLGYVRYRLWRVGTGLRRRGGIAARDTPLTILVLAVVVPYSVWLAVSLRSVHSAMIAAGGAIALALLVGIRVWLWVARRGRQDGPAVIRAESGKTADALVEDPVSPTEDRERGHQ